MGIIGSALALRFGLVAAVALSIGGAYLAGSYRGATHAERDCEMANEAAKSQMLGDLLRSQEEAHQYHLAEVARGDAISAELAKTQRRLNETKTEYLAFAHGITGNCPAELGAVMHHQAIPNTPEIDNKQTAIPAHMIATNIVENRYRFESNYAQCMALINWTKGDQNAIEAR